MLRPERRIARRPAEAGTSRPWWDHLVLVGSVATLLLGYRTVVEGADWWVTTSLVCLLVGLSCAVLRALGVRWVAPVALVVLGLALTWIFVPGTLLGVLPTPSSVSALAAMVERAQVIIMQEAAPAGAARPIVLVLAACFGLVVVVADALLRRRRGVVPVGVLLLGVHVAPSLISGRAPSVLLFLVPAAGWLWLLRSRTRSATARRGGWSGAAPALVLGTAALAAVVVLPPAMPEVTGMAARWGEPPPTVFGRGINPMLQLGQNLRRNSTVVSATYTTTYGTPPNLKVSTLADFNGQTWRPLGGGAGGIPEGASAVREDIEVRSRRTDVTIQDLRSSLLPVPYPVVDVQGLAGTWSLQRAGQTISSRSADTEGQEYTVESLEVRPTAQQMRSLRQEAPAALQYYLQLPGDVPEIVSRTAREVTADARTHYDRALALQDHLRTQLEYSETAPVAGDYDGNGVQVLGEFLREGSGYCVHFSSAMAVMAREMGIPARVAVGFAPGRATTMEQGRQRYEVTSDDLHAWPELHFPGVGWIPFEPTPGIGSATVFSEPTTQAPEGEEAAPEGAEEEQEEVETEQPDAEAVQAVESTTATAPRSVAVVGLGVVALGLAPGAVRLLLRRRRLGAGGGPDPRWREVEATALDLGHDVPPAGTARALASSLEQAGGVDAAALERLLRDVETSRYARPGGTRTDEGSAAREVVGSLVAAAPARARWRARVLPRSLWRR